VKSLENVLVIGITGNIGVGKSVVRRMLERLGALGIDADALTHRVLLRDSPLYDRIVSKFGNKILGEDEEINRSELAKLIFNNKKSLQDLENLIHPAVSNAIYHIINNVPSPVFAIEAVKLLESDLMDLCDAVWLVDAPRQKQLKRILENRPLTVNQVQERLDHQTPVETKRQKAQVIINNYLSLENTWNQVIAEIEGDGELAGQLKNKLKISRLNQQISPEFKYLLPGQSSDLDTFFTRLITIDSNHSLERISSPQPLTQKEYEGIKKTDRFELLTSYQGVIHAGYSLGLINFENFMLEPLFFHQVASQTMSDLTAWLMQLEKLAAQRSSEAIIFPLRKSCVNEKQVLQDHGFSPLSRDSLLWKIWKDQNPKNDRAGYNVYYQTLRKTITFIK